MVRPVFRKVSLAGCLLWCAYLPLPSHADSRTTIAAPAIAAYVSGTTLKRYGFFVILPSEATPVLKPCLEPIMLTANLYRKITPRR
jgi:hypothetical protein